MAKAGRKFEVLVLNQIAQQGLKRFAPERYALVKEAKAPDVVLVRGRARQIMLVAEAARAAGIAGDGAAMGRPACAMIPAVLGGPTGVTSLGCIGNRVYTGLGDAELYFTIPGGKLGEVVDKLATVVHANRELQAYHEGRRQTLGDARP